MTKLISAEDFQGAEGIGNWRVLLGGAWVYFRTGSFSLGTAFGEAVGHLADEADAQLDIEVRRDGVTVRLAAHGIGIFSEADVALARAVSTAAADRGLAADPAAIQTINVAIDALVVSDVRPFWRAVLGYMDGYRTEGPEYLVDPYGHGPVVWFQQMEAPRPQRNRIHVDVLVPHDQAESRVAAAIAEGGRLISDRHAPSWWVLADAEGNEACVATWVGRG